MINFGDSRLPDRFWDKVRPCPMSGCWLWTGAHVWNEYGVVTVGGRQRYVHRVSYQALVGEVPAGLQLDHLCRQRCCVNPMHLEPVTQRENMRRGKQGEIWGTETHCRNGHEYTDENTAPRSGRRNGRMCRACNRDKTARHREMLEATGRGPLRRMTRAQSAELDNLLRECG